jgi:hypothetical protein
MRVVDVPPRSPSRRGARLDERVRDATTNVTTAMAGAADRGPLPHQVEQAAEEWTTEATRVVRDLRVAERLTGDAHKQALRALRSRVDELERVAGRIVDTAFLAPLTPSPDVDRLLHAVERIEALEQAYRELDDLEHRGWTVATRASTVRLRVRVPDRFRRATS